MRTWPYQILSAIPNQYILGQWRECLAISGMIAKSNNILKMDGINHATINRIKDYPLNHFIVYCNEVKNEMINRGFTIGTNTIEKLNNDIDFEKNLQNLILNHNYVENTLFQIIINNEILFENFHNERYIKQCYYMFQEKYDCKMLNKEYFDFLNKKINILLNCDF